MPSVSEATNSSPKLVSVSGDASLIFMLSTLLQTYLACTSALSAVISTSNASYRCGMMFAKFLEQIAWRCPTEPRSKPNELEGT